MCVVEDWRKGNRRKAKAYIPLVTAHGPFDHAITKCQLSPTSNFLSPLLPSRCVQHHQTTTTAQLPVNGALARRAHTMLDASYGLLVRVFYFSSIF